jgi:hypothetical protein
MRFVVIVAFAAAVLAGCGSSSDPASSDAASAVPASAAAYVSIQSDLDSAQWQQVEELLDRFPDGERAIQRLHGDVATGVSYERDLEPALGPTVELVWLDFANDGQNVVGLTQPDDEDKLRALARKGDEYVVVEEVGGWSVVARSEALIDRYRQALDDGSIGDDTAFERTSEALPDESLATVYVDGERATNALEAVVRDRGGSTGALESAGRLEAGAAALEAEGTGFRLTAFIRAHGVAPELTDVGTLLKEVPAGAFLAVNFHGTRETTDGLVPEQLGPLGEEFGPALRTLGSLFQGEGVFYARPSPLRPEFTLLLAPPNPLAVKAELDLLISTLPGLRDVERRHETVDGVDATILNVRDDFVIAYAAWDDRLALTTSLGGIRALREPGDRLVDEDRYRDAVAAAGVTDDEHVVAYADLQRALPLFEQLVSSTAPVPVVPTESGNLRPLQSLVASVRGEGDDTTFRLFVEIQ